VYEDYKNEVLGHYQKEIVKKICREVDDHLRLLIHSILIDKLKARNPFESPIEHIHHYLTNGNFEILNTIINPVEEVQKYLDENFYNLNVLNLHDYETYEGLRSLAKNIFKIDLLHTYIPS